MKANTLQDKRCLVTGATGGLGREITLANTGQAVNFSLQGEIRPCSII
jgi:short-subunit dehydrogenase